MLIKQYHIYLVNLDPTIGHEIKKTKPFIVISPDEMNNNISTIIIAPMTTTSHSYPTKVQLKFQNKTGYIVLDQIRTIDKKRIIKELGTVNKSIIKKIKSVLHEMLIE